MYNKKKVLLNLVSKVYNKKYNSLEKLLTKIVINLIKPKKQQLGRLINHLLDQQYHLHNSKNYHYYSKISQTYN
jgi:hypothetical protein